MANPCNLQIGSTNAVFKRSLTIIKKAFLTSQFYYYRMAERPSFINSLYEESFGLLVEARNYFQYSETNRTAISTGAPRDRLFVNYQAMRLTSRMTQAMAWLLAQRAVQAGELSPVQACGGSYSLGGERICIDPEGHNDNRVPTPMRTLLDRSHSIYMRVWRLDQAARTKMASTMYGE